MNPKKSTPRHIIIKMAKFKEEEGTLKDVRERQLLTYKGTPIRLSVDFSTETFWARRDWHEIFKVMKNMDLQSTLPSKIIT